MSCSPRSPWITLPAPRKSSALKKAWRDEVEDAGGVRAQPHRREHVAELADRGVGEHLLDVGLREPDGGGEERGDRRPTHATTASASGAISKSVWQRATM